MIALLPIKEHSERVPGKNFRDFCGKPLYLWILDTILRVPDVEKVVINTDSEMLLASPPDSRVWFRRRKPELCGDNVSMNWIIADDLDATDGEHYIQTHATNPLLSPSTIQKAIESYDGSSLFSVTNIQERLYWEGGGPINHSPLLLQRTQDLPIIQAENSCLYLFSRESFRESHQRIGAGAIRFETPPLESVDIDTEEDWKLAEALMK